MAQIEAHSCKFPLVNICQALLSAHEQFMRLHSDSEIEKMNGEDVLSILQMGAGTQCISLHMPQSKN